MDPHPARRDLYRLLAVDASPCREDPDPSRWFPESLRGARYTVAVRHATSACQGCTKRLLCAAWALDMGEPFGIWGGLSEAQRRTLSRVAPRLKEDIVMLVRGLVHAWTTAGRIGPGKIIEIDPDAARVLIERGYVEAVEQVTTSVIAAAGMDMLDQALAVTPHAADEADFDDLDEDEDEDEDE